ncbi:hypothetical protein N0V90_012737 [Kalmusia sp. IMI 367209]|nr:hypothetical protein N0V90_012737 [Kalmusia sp. IMI 367209]
MDDENVRPVIIIGAGISGLLLAQHLIQSGVPFRIFERRNDLVTTNVGWGLTLQWSLPALRSLLPHDLVQRLPEIYVDRVAVKQGQASAFPFFDLSTGELKAATPLAPESQRIRVGREKFRGLLATSVPIEARYVHVAWRGYAHMTQWNKTFTTYNSDEYSVTAFFEDGSQCVGSLLVACDGSHSLIRRVLFPEKHSNPIPIRVMGTKVQLTPGQIEPLRKLDPFFLQATSSKNNTFMFFSVIDAVLNVDTVLDAPENEGGQDYIAQIVASWPYRNGFLDRHSPTDMPSTNVGRAQLLRMFAETWAEPFRSFALGIPSDADLKPLELSDWLPPKDFRGSARVALIGDAFHPMAMYRGDGANHAIMDVQQFAQKVAPILSARSTEQTLRAALDTYEDEVTARTRPAVLASRQAALDAHDYGRIDAQSPLLSRRAMKLEFDEREHT